MVQPSPAPVNPTRVISRKDPTTFKEGLWYSFISTTSNEALTPTWTDQIGPVARKLMAFRPDGKSRGRAAYGACATLIRQAAPGSAVAPWVSDPVPPLPINRLWTRDPT